MIRIVLRSLGAALVIAGCGPATVASRDIPAQDQDLVAAGELLYAAHCAECHGADLRGTNEGPSHLSILYEPGHHGDGAFQVAVLIGSTEHHWKFGPMPPVEGLSDDQVKTIVAFVREMQRLEGFEPYPPT